MNLFKRILGLGKPMLTCADANAFITEYLEDSLDAQTRDSFKDHVGKCPNCTAFLSQFNTTIDLCKSDGQIEAPPELVESTLEFLRSKGLGAS